MTKNIRHRFLMCAVVALAGMTAFPAAARAASSCDDLPQHDTLRAALVAARQVGNGGFNFDMWGAIVDRNGRVCAVAFTGADLGDQWPGSRMIAAQKAYTANAFSLDGLALATANLYSATQPGGSLFGLQDSNPVDTNEAYRASVTRFGTRSDPMVNLIVGGINVFGGGLALYNASGKVVGGLGVSGDSSCADHNIAWRTRHGLSLDYVPSGVAPGRNDQIIYDIRGGRSASGYGHPTCGGTEHIIARTLPPVREIFIKAE